MIHPKHRSSVVFFTGRQVQFIHLYYQKCLTLREAAKQMGCTTRNTKELSTRILNKLGLCREYGCELGNRKILALQIFMDLGLARKGD